MSKLDWSRPLETASGIPARFLGTVRNPYNLGYNNIVVLQYSPDDEAVVRFNDDGVSQGGSYILVQAPHTVWAVVYRPLEGGNCFASGAWYDRRDQAVAEATGGEYTGPVGLLELNPETGALKLHPYPTNPTKE